MYKYLSINIIIGFSMMEQGTVVGRKLTFHLKQFLRRTFGVGSNGIDLEVREVC